MKVWLLGNTGYVFSSRQAAVDSVRLTYHKVAKVYDHNYYVEIESNDPNDKVSTLKINIIETTVYDEAEHM